MKQTAVEWLEQQIGSRISDANIRISAPKFYELVNQAKEMEREQIIEAYCNGDDNISAKQYYNETFKSE